MDITNTTKIDPDEMLADMIEVGASTGIEAQEVQGQLELAGSDVLPVACDDRPGFEAAGVVFGEPLLDDPLFCRAVLPPGWRKLATGHPLWTDLLDEQKRRRGRIFYKAAFYDRDAKLYIEKISESKEAE